VYRIAEPNPATATAATVDNVSEFTYPGGEDLNAESLFWHGGNLFLISKESRGTARLFRIDLGSGQAVQIGVVAASLDPVTDADVSDDGHHLAMTTESKRLVVLRNQGSSTGQARVVDPLPDRIAGRITTTVPRAGSLRMGRSPAVTPTLGTTSRPSPSPPRACNTTRRPCR
jgi:hypothetical protein